MKSDKVHPKLLLIKGTLWNIFHINETIIPKKFEHSSKEIYFDEFNGLTLDQISKVLKDQFKINSDDKLVVESHHSGLQEFFFKSYRPETNDEIIQRLSKVKSKKIKKDTYKTEDKLVHVEIESLPANEIYKDLLIYITLNETELYQSNNECLVTEDQINMSILYNLLKVYKIDFNEVQFII